MKGSFLQTSSAMVLRRYTMDKAILPDEARQELLAFLSGSSATDYDRQSGQIVGILKQMEEEMDKALAEARAAEEEGIKSYDALMEAKTKEVDALTAQIEKEQTRIGDLGVEIAGMENDLEDTQQSLGDDKKFIEELEKNCKKKKKEWAGIQKLPAWKMTWKTLN